MDCKSIDAQVVRPDDPQLTALLGRFVPVRLTSLKNVDLNTFRFDYDLTFTALMMNADGHTYSRYGTRDTNSATDRLSIPGLKTAMRGALAWHEKQAGKKPVTSSVTPRKTFTAADYPAFARSKLAQESCYHCHYANDARYKQLRADRTFTKRMLFQYPLPENIGITLNVDTNNVVKSVRPDSPAQRVGVKPGDVVVAANDTPVLTSADLQFILNGVPEPGTVTLQVTRNQRPLKPMMLRLTRGWRETDISWRPSQGAIPPILGIWEQPLTGDEKKQRGIAPDRMALRVSFVFPGEKWKATYGDLRLNDVIVGVGGRELGHMSPRQFHTYFRLNFNVGAGT